MWAWHFGKECCGVGTWPDPSSTEDGGGGRGGQLTPESSWRDEVALGGGWRQGVLVLRYLDQLGDNMGWEKWPSYLPERRRTWLRSGAFWEGRQSIILPTAIAKKW